MSTPRFATMTIEDHARSMSLWQGTPGIGLSAADSYDNMREYLERNKDLSQCAFLGEELVGTILAGHDGRRGYLHHLCVREDCRQQGIGRRLVENALDALAAIGLDKAHAFIFADNAQGRRFWTGIGWTWRTDLGIVSCMTGRERS